MALDSTAQRMILFLGVMIIVGGIVVFYYFYGNKWLEGKDTKASINKTVERKSEQDRESSENMLDIQFSETNRPLIVYKDMFTKSAPWIGGYDIGIGKTIISQAQKAK